MKHIAIKKQILNGSEVNSVSGRDLHANLGVKKAFTTWITSALDTMGSVDGEDFLKLKSSLKGSGYQWDYILTIDLAKHISMMSKVPAGKEMRQYFIDVETQYNKNAIKSLEDHKHKIHALLEYTDKMGEVVTEHDKRINNLENNTRIEAWQQKVLLDTKNTKLYQLANGNEKLANKLHSAIWRKFKNRFHIPRYDALTSGKYEEALNYLNNLTIDMVV